jgi:hypothetical protein
LTPTELILARLEAHFDQHYVLDSAPYLKAAQVVHRLNEVLGVAGWTHSVLRDGFDEASDTLWCYGQLRGLIDGQPFVREAYGGQKIKRSRTTQAALNYGDDLKAAQTDSLKKCAKELGVGGYLDDPAEVALATREQAERRRPAASGAVVANGSGLAVDTSTGEVVTCATCNKPLEVHRFANNDTWSAQELARRSTAKFGKTLCFEHYKAANDEKAVASAERIPALRRGPLPPEAGG